MQPAVKHYLTTLTPLRGIAALLVVIFHANLQFPIMPPGYTHLISSGWLWVDFFFVLSGFVIAYAYGDEFRDSLSRGSYWQYIRSRFARIYPLHLFTLVWALIVSLIIRSLATGLDPFFAAIFNPAAAPACLLLIQSLNLYITAPLNTPSWSLSTEWWVYMVFPLLMPLFARQKMTGRILTLLVIAALYVVLKFVLGPLESFDGSPTLDLITKFAIFRCLGGFLLGMLLHGFYEARTGHRIFKNSGCFVVLSLATLAAMHFGMPDLLIVALFPLVLLSAVYNTTGVKKVLDKPFLQRLGDWSFSIYMVHMPISFTFDIWEVSKDPGLYKDFMAFISRPPDYGHGLLVCALLVGATLLVAPLTYRFVELPCRTWINRRWSRPEKVPVTAAR
jgi:peptidoglycan/LPS O-acetylase OafA/YrhL